MLLDFINLLKAKFREYLTQRVWGIWCHISRHHHTLFLSRWSLFTWIWYYNIIYNIRNDAIIFMTHLFNCPHVWAVALPVTFRHEYSPTLVNSWKWFKENSTPPLLDLIFIVVKISLFGSFTERLIVNSMWQVTLKFWSRDEYIITIEVMWLLSTWKPFGCLHHVAYLVCSQLHNVKNHLFTIWISINII